MALQVPHVLEHPLQDDHRLRQLQRGIRDRLTLTPTPTPTLILTPNPTLTLTLTPNPNPTLTPTLTPTQPPNPNPNEVSETVYEGDREKLQQPAKPMRPLPSSTKKATKKD